MKKRIILNILLLLTEKPMTFNRLCLEFNIDITTLHRYLTEIRKAGISVHSRNGVVELFTDLNTQKIKDYLNIKGLEDFKYGNYIPVGTK